MPKTSDRSAEPALQESLNHGPRSTAPARPEDDNDDAGPDSHPRNGSRDAGDTIPADPGHVPDDEEVEEMTGVPTQSKELSDM